jgi:hypothetical protein
LFYWKAAYIPNPLDFTWVGVRESAKAADAVVEFESEPNKQIPTDQKYAFENRDGVLIRQYPSAFTIALDKNRKYG